MRRFRLLLLGSALALVAASYAGGGDRATETFAARPTGEAAITTAEIVFARGPHLYVMRSNGSRVRLLVRNAGDPAVSPDGRQIAFVRESSLWVMKRDGSSRRRLTTPPTVSQGHGQTGDYEPAWSSDGRRLYFSRFIEDWSNDSMASSLVSIRSDGTKLKRLTQVVSNESPHNRCIGDPTPSPTGQLIAYVEWGDCEHGYDPSIEAVTPAGRRTALGFTLPCAFDPAYAPDGRQLAYAAMQCEGDRLGIYTQSRGGDERRLAAGLSDSPAWSPDGTTIAFVRGWDQGDIWLVRSAGGGLRRITHTRANDQMPAWLPPAR
jgi:Tol biopolymer transport system component